MVNKNRIANCANPFQGGYKKVLCVCSAGLLRSPTAAVVLASEPYNFNTRAAGIDKEYALIPVDDVLLAWADEIICMTKAHERALLQMVGNLPIDLKMSPIICLDIPDSFAYRDPKLMKAIKESYDATQGNEE